MTHPHVGGNGRCKGDACIFHYCFRRLGPVRCGIGGAGMAIPEMTMLASIFRKKLVATIVVVIFLTAVITGYLFNILL